MATVIQTTNIGTGINVAGASFVYVKDGVLVSHTTGPGINADAGNSRITVEGGVTAVTQQGILTGNAAEGFGVGNSRVIVGSSGMVSGANSAIGMAGENNVVENHGMIAENGTLASNGSGIVFFGQGGDGGGGGNTVTNTGTITGNLSAIIFQNAADDRGNTVNNSGMISGLQGAIVFEAGAVGEVNLVVNSGSIEAGQGNTSGFIAIDGTDFEEAVFNTGTIRGRLVLDGGLDTVDNRGGEIIGVVDMGAGDDVFIGGAGSERVMGNAGNDSIDLGGGDDIFLAGETTVDANDGNDEIDGGTAGERGNTYDAGAATVALNISLADSRAFSTQTGQDVIHGFQNAIGGTAADTIEGDGGANRLNGGGSNDTLSGLAGADRLIGGSGIDTIRGGLGRDVMTGGANADTFVFSASDTGVGAGVRDVITDFAAGVDEINLSALDADSTLGGNQAFTFIGAGAFTNVAGQLRVVGNASERATLVEGDTNGNGVADFQIVLHGNLAMAAGDFIV